MTDVNVTFSITHTWDDDVVVSITSPAVAAVQIMSNCGGSGDNFAEHRDRRRAASRRTAASWALPYAARSRPCRARRADREPDGAGRVQRHGGERHVDADGRRRLGDLHGHAGWRGRSRSTVRRRCRSSCRTSTSSSTHRRSGVIKGPARAGPFFFAATANPVSSASSWAWNPGSAESGRAARTRLERLLAPSELGQQEYRAQCRARVRTATAPARPAPPRAFRRRGAASPR